jgi:hypothetical protein
MKDSHKFLTFLLFLLVFSIYGIIKDYYKYKNDPNPISIKVFYSGLAGIISSTILIILYLLGKIPFNE